MEIIEGIVTIMGNIALEGKPDEWTIKVVDKNDVVVGGDGIIYGEDELWEIELKAGTKDEYRIRPFVKSGSKLNLGDKELKFEDYIAHLNEDDGSYDIRLHEDGQDSNNNPLYNIQVAKKELGYKDFLTMTIPYKWNSISLEGKKWKKNRTPQRWRFNKVSDVETKH